MTGYVFIGDDFTGASDTLATLAEAGLRARLFLDPPDAGTVSGEALDAVGFATDLRALTPGRIAARLEGLTPPLRVLAPRILHYKVCSTFDSAPDIGSIGAAVAALERLLEPAMTVIVGGQPSLGRYCVFGNLFARGPDGAVHRIDRHPVMSRHPVTPMGEADLRLHLAAQGIGELALEPWQGLGEGLAGRLQAHIANGRRRVLVDAARQDDVALIGAALAGVETDGRPLLVVGASSVAEAFLLAWKAAPSSSGRARTDAPARHSTPRLVIAGSRSAVTAAQIEAARLYEKLPLRRADLAEQALQRIAADAARRMSAGGNVLVHLLPDEDYGLPGGQLAERLALLAEAIFGLCPAGGLCVAGGDSSSAVVHRLGVASMEYVDRFGPGVALCLGRSAATEVDGLTLLLKGGQVGAVDIFDRFAELPARQAVPDQRVI